MKKIRVFAILLIVVMLITGCGGAALTEEEYKTQFTDFYKNYIALSGDYVDALTSEKYADAITGVDKCLTVLEDFTKITAPDKFKESHSALVKSIGEEKTYLNAVNKFLGFAEKYDTLSEGEMTDFQKAKDDMENAADSSTFADSLLNTAKAIKG